MPTLTYTSSNTQYGGSLNARVLIGRKLSHGVVIDDPQVARLHAWIDPASDDSGQWIVNDAGGKLGTYINEKRITRQSLHDGDVIRVGAVEVLFSDRDAMPRGAKRVDLSSPTGVVKTAGILFNCHCGAPLWVGNDLAGKRGMCRHCKTTVTVPMQSPAATSLPPVKISAPKRTGKCGVCHSALLPDEQTIQCADCAVSFHAECWQENMGCSSYGCPQVDALNPAAAKPAVESFEPTVLDEVSPLPWGLILLAASVVSSILGALCFGGPALIVALISIGMLVRGKLPRRGLLIAAIVISFAGVPVGLAVSDFFYLNAQHLPAVLNRH